MNDAAVAQVRRGNAINAFHERLNSALGGKLEGGGRREMRLPRVSGMNRARSRANQAQYLTFKVVCDWQTCRGSGGVHVPLQFRRGWPGSYLSRDRERGSRGRHA